ncbi:hypothetical protein BS78_05G203000 [Paspalum vaginatum]|nr:hypothetical protein BS78_05G203000 [Paspalum vaginatum]
MLSISACRNLISLLTPFCSLYSAKRRAASLGSRLPSATDARAPWVIGRPAAVQRLLALLTCYKHGREIVVYCKAAGGVAVPSQLSRSRVVTEGATVSRSSIGCIDFETSCNGDFFLRKYNRSNRHRRP